MIYSVDANQTSDYERALTEIEQATGARAVAGARMGVIEPPDARPYFDMPLTDGHILRVYPGPRLLAVARLAGWYRNRN